MWKYHYSMETKNTIEYQIEKEHFENVVQGMLKRDIEDALRYKPHLENIVRRNYNLITDFLGINTPELDIPEIADKYNLCSERVRQITHRFAKRYFLKSNRRFYLNGEDYPLRFDLERNVRREI